GDQPLLVASARLQGLSGPLKQWKPVMVAHQPAGRERPAPSNLESLDRYLGGRPWLIRGITRPASSRYRFHIRVAGDQVSDAYNRVHEEYREHGPRNGTDEEIRVISSKRL